MSSAREKNNRDILVKFVYKIDKAEYIYNLYNDDHSYDFYNKIRNVDFFKKRRTLFRQNIDDREYKNIEYNFNIDKIKQLINDSRIDKVTKTLNDLITKENYLKKMRLPLSNNYIEIDTLENIIDQTSKIPEPKDITLTKLISYLNKIKDKRDILITDEGLRKYFEDELNKNLEGMDFNILSLKEKYKDANDTPDDNAQTKFMYYMISILKGNKEIKNSEHNINFDPSYHDNNTNYEETARNLKGTLEVKIKTLIQMLENINEILENNYTITLPTKSGNVGVKINYTKYIDLKLTNVNDPEKKTLLDIIRNNIYNKIYNDKEKGQKILSSLILSEEKIKLQELSKGDNRSERLENLFLIKENGNENNIKSIFNSLDENFKYNKALKQKEQKKTTEEVPKWNEPETLKEKLYEYGKYFYTKDEYKNMNKKSFYDEIVTNTELQQKIITYHNIHKLLIDLYCVKGTIINDSFYKKRHGIIKKVPNNHIKIKSITPRILKQEQKYNFSSRPNIIEVFFDIEFEEVPIFSIIKLHLNILDDEKIFTSSSEPIYSSNRYKLYNMSIFFKQEDLNKIDQNMYFDKKLNYKKILTNYNIYKKNYPEIFKDIKTVDDIKKIFVSKQLFDHFYYSNIYEDKNNNKNIFKIINKYYIKHFFLRIENILNRHGKKFKIIDVKIKNPKVLNFNDEESNKELDRMKRDFTNKFQNGSENLKQLLNINIKDHTKLINEYKDYDVENLINKNKEIQNNIKSPFTFEYNKLQSRITKNLEEYRDQFMENKHSEDVRLAFFNEGNSYNFYLDVHVLELDEKGNVSIKRRLSSRLNCYEGADNLDKLLYNFLGEHLYPDKRLFRKEVTKIYNKKNAMIGGLKRSKSIKKYDNIKIKKNRTLKNLIQYYNN
tara:strand:+ start:8480 stop:11155 length:2676 start_codon:yes stop_codon:yes gene_type:complete